MAFTVNPYDHSGTLDTSGYDQAGEDVTVSFPDIGEVTFEDVALGPDQSVSTVVVAFSDATLQDDSDARVQYDPYRQNHGQYWIDNGDGTYTYALV